MFSAVEELHRLCQGAYAVVALIAGVVFWLFVTRWAFVRCLWPHENKHEWLAVSESAAFRPLGFKDEGDLQPGEAVL